MSPVRRATLSVVFCSALLVGCGTTIVETDPTDPPMQEVVDAPIPTSTNGQLTEMVTLTTGLSDLIVSGDSKDAYARIVDLWEAASVVVEDVEPALGREFVRQMDLVRSSVERKRPADADKASRNLTVIVDDYVAQHP